MCQFINIFLNIRFGDKSIKCVFNILLYDCIILFNTYLQKSITINLFFT